MDPHARAQQKLAEVVQICRGHALPLTVQRRQVLEVLVVRTDHPTADQIFEAVCAHMPEISRTTVYRVLETFVRIGVARKVSHPGAIARYEIERERHHHCICRACGRILDVHEPSLDTLPQLHAPHDFHIEDYSIQFRGLCADCAAQAADRRPARATAPRPADRERTPFC
jgi:Fur family peroxide stress response transcriptional regulator